MRPAVDITNTKLVTRPLMDEIRPVKRSLNLSDYDESVQWDVRVEFEIREAYKCYSYSLLLL